MVRFNAVVWVSLARDLNAKLIIVASAIGARSTSSSNVHDCRLRESRRANLDSIVELPLDIHSDNATYESQFGYVSRPTHRNTSWDAAK